MPRFKRFSRLFRGHVSTAVTLLLGGVMMMVSRAEAQITFAWAGTPPNVSTYTTVDECLGMLKRVSAEQSTPPTSQRTDTFPKRLVKPANHTPEPVITAAQLCSAKFSVDAILQQANQDINAIENAFRLFLAADRTLDAMTLAQRWLQALPPNSDTLRTVITKRLALHLLGVKPVRFTEAVQLAESIDLPRFWISAFEVMGTILELAIQHDDVVRAKATAEWFVPMPKRLGDGVTSTLEWRGDRRRAGLGWPVLKAQLYLHPADLLAKLRESTQLYEEYMASLSNASAMPYFAEDRKAKPIMADWWFPANPAEGRPTPGKVSIVTSKVSNECGMCLGEAAGLRRLHEKFPAVEMTFLMRTWGSHGNIMEPPSPEVEARFLDSLYRIHNGMPIVVAVENGKFWRLPDLDRRRIDEPGPNQDLYPTLGRNGVTLIFDKEGNIVRPFGVEDTEDNLHQILEILLARPQK